MATSQKVFICGRCNEYGAPSLEELVAHMTSCGVAEIRKKGESTKYEDNEEDDNDVMFDESENSESAIEYADNSEEKKSPENQKNIDRTYIPIQSGYHRPYIIDAGGTSPSPFLWSKNTALLLLNLIKSHREDMDSPYIRKKAVWQKIALEMQENHGYCVTPTQCENKFKNISSRYRRAKDSDLPPNKKLKQTCFTYSELDEYFRNDPRFQPKSDSKAEPEDRPKVILNHDVVPKVVSNVITPKIVESSKYDSDRDCPETDTVTISECEDSNNCKDSEGNEAEPMWVKKMMETFERCHRENMKMQREFIGVLKKILEKK